MKKIAVFLLVIASFRTVFSMNNQARPFQLHQPIHGYLDPRLRAWLLNMIYRQRLQPVAPVCKVVLTSDGHTAITASEDNVIRIWDIPSGTCSHVLTGHTGPIVDVKIIQERNLIVTISQDSTARIWDLAKGICLHILAGHTAAVLDVTLTPDGTVAITRSADNTARIWDIGSGVCTCTLNCNPEALQCAVLTPDGNTAITKSQSAGWLSRDPNHLRICDARTGAVRHMLSDRSNDKIVVSPEGKTVITKDCYGLRGATYVCCELWDIATGTRSTVLSDDFWEGDPEGHNGDFPRVIAFGSENFVILAYDKKLLIIDLITGTRKKVPTGYFLHYVCKMKSVMTYPTDNTIVGFSTDNTLRIFDLEKAKMTILDNSEQGSFFRQCPDVTAFSADTRTAVTVSKNHALVWNLPQGTLRRVLPNPFVRAVGPQDTSQEQHKNNEGLLTRMWAYSASWFNKSYNNLVVNPNGTCLAAVTADGCTVQTWNIADQDPAGALENLSVFQIALLTEILHRTQTGGQRLILRPGSNNHAAYQSLHPIIRNAIRPYIGTYRPASVDDCILIQH